MAKKNKGKVETPINEVVDKKGKKKSKKEEVAKEPEGPTKPQRGLAIGENFGWTGKLPATLLFEYAQKHKWERVVIDMRKNAKGYTGVVNLAWKNPKTQEIIKVQMIPHSDTYKPKETTNEARHFAATYALFRINFVKNMKMVLPNIFRDYWSDLETSRLELLKSNKELHDQIYNSDPFQVFLAQREKKEKLEKERLIKEQNEQKIKKTVMNIAPIAKPEAKKSNSISSNKVSKPELSKISKLSTKVATFSKKVWQNAPFIDFDSDTRTKIEASVRKHIDWTIDLPHQTTDSQNEYSSLLLQFGFRKTHIDECLKYTSTFTNSLEWLLFHIPEDDLPAFFQKKDEDSAISVKLSKDIRLENLTKRLAQSGADLDDILKILKDTNNDELKASILLTYHIIGYSPKTEDNVEENSRDLWKQEIEVFEMTNSDIKIDIETEDVTTISLSPENIAKGLLSIRLFRCDNYPHELLGIQLISNNPTLRIANYIKISILRQLSNYIIESGLLGNCYIFNIIEWMEENIAKIIDNPGPLLPGDQLRKTSNLLIDSTSSISKKSAKSKKLATKYTKEELEKLFVAYKEKLASQDMKSSITKRMSLPAWKKASELVSVINNNKVTIVTGETGSGKSTQIIQFILDDLNSKGNFESKIMCTQPRRISTIGLADRISDERCDKVGQETGYIIRGENKTSRGTRISFVTTGVLLRMIQNELSLNKLGTGIFANLEYIFIDEVHERSVDSDFLLIILKSIMNKLPNLKIILMSATINIDGFQTFFKMPVNHVHVEGRTFPIKDIYLDEILEDIDFQIVRRDGEVVVPKADSTFFTSGEINYDLIAKLCDHIDEKLDQENNDGSILIFLPGIMEISKCINAINRNDKFWSLPLHSALTSSDQKRVFKSPGKGLRKIVVSTNVAETSITIPDCVVVIDSGRSKSLFFDTKINSTKLIEDWCSKAEVKQRRGRSGRITEGTCYHLYTKETEMEMRSQPIPEIKRTRLENLYLVVKSMGIDKVEEFLNNGLDPPDSSSLKKSKQFLMDLGALEENGKISHLGKYLSLLPTDLQCGKLLILGCIFSCLETCLTIAAISITGSPFKGAFEDRDKIRNIQGKFANNQGDLIAIVNAFNQYQELKGSESKKFLTENYLSYMTMKELTKTRDQFVSILQDIGFVPLNYSSNSLDLNFNNEKYNIVRAIITGAYYPQIARVQNAEAKFQQTLVGAVEIDSDARQTKFYIRNEDYMDNLRNGEEIKDIPQTNRAFIHPSSVLFSQEETQIFNNMDAYTKEDGTIDMEKAQTNYKIEFTPDVSKILSARHMLKAPFLVYNTSHHTSKHFLRDITPTSTLAVLLFGGNFGYDLTSGLSSGKSVPGVVIDGVWPIRTWCKNGVLIKKLRQLLDGLIEDRLSNPFTKTQAKSSSDDVLGIVEQVLRL